MKPKFTLETSEAGTTLLVSGDLVVRHSEEFKAQLMTLLESHKVLSLSLQEVTSIDATALQLVYAFQQAVQYSNKRVSLLLGPTQTDVSALLSNTGSDIFLTARNNQK